MMDSMNNNLDIDKATTLEEIAEIKKNAYLTNKNSGIHIERILSGLYKNPTHFIFELLQNAEDAGASNVEIELDADKIIFSHNGREFNLRDLKGITGVDYSSKADDITQIGRFGIGFKAVFSICDAPEIYSGQYNFRIRNFYVPESIDLQKQFHKKGFTFIVLPFKQDVKDYIYDKLEKALVDLDPDTILFLKNISQLDYLTLKRSGFYVRKNEKKQIKGETCFVTQIISGQNNGSSYIMFQEKLADNIPLEVSLAYPYDIEKNQLILEDESSKLVVFFPTERDTFLKFKINGPYQTTPTRENIPETEENKKVLKKTVELYKKSLLVLCNLGLVDAKFLESLPIINRSYSRWNGADLFYDSFYNATIECFRTLEILPTNKQDYVSAENCILARGQALTELINEDDLKIFFEKDKWLSTDITRDNTNNLVLFLINVLKVREVNFEYFLSKLNLNFFLNKTKKWFLKFYSLCNSNIITVKKFLTTPFVLTKSGKVVSPYIQGSNGELFKNVYLQSQLMTDGSKVVDDEILNNEIGDIFFRTIGISEMDIVESVRTQWLPNILASIDENDYFDSLQILFLEIFEYPSDTQKKLFALLGSSKCLAFKGSNGKLVFTEPNNLFMAHGDSKILYDNCKDAKFITELVNRKAIENKEFYDFLKKIGVNTSVKLISTTKGLSDEERRNLLQKANYSMIKENSVDIWGFTDILSNITKQKSKALWNALNNISENNYTSKLEWWYYSRYNSTTYKSNFVRLLQNRAWLFNDDGDCVCPNEIFEDDVRAIYGGGPCLRHFMFKPNAVKSLPEEEQRKLELTKDIPIEVLEQMRERYVSLTKPEEIDIVPEENPVEIEEVELENPRDGLTAEELTEKHLDKTDKEEQGVTDLIDELYEDVNIPDTIIEQIVVKKVSNEAELDGDLGERFVISALKKKYQKKEYAIYNDTKDGFTAIKDERVVDVVRHNKGGKIQKGYDISVSSKGEVLAYIEVKSKKGGDKEFFKVSGLQWEFAKKLNEEGNGDKHYVYVVTNVREPDKTKIASVKNPYKLWLDGKLEVDPVRIKY